MMFLLIVTAALLLWLWLDNPPVPRNNPFEEKDP